MPRLRPWAPVVVCLAATVAAAAAQGPTSPGVEQVADSVADPRALYLPDGRWGNTTNGRSFQQDAVTSLQGHQYETHFDADRKLCLGRRKLGEPDWDVIRFDDYRFEGNDTHNAPVLGICPADGTIHLSFDHHGHPLHYRVSQPGAATNPKGVTWDAALFGPVTDQLEPGRKVSRVTYPRFLETPAGGLQFQCRIGGSGDGASWLADYADGRWSGFGPFITGAGEFGGSRTRNAYENGFTYDRSGRLHVTWCWRESGDPMTNHDILYAWSDDGGRSWRNNAGEPIGSRGDRPVTIDSPGLKVWDIPTRRGLINSTTQAVDGDGRIHVVTWHLPDETPCPEEWEATKRLTRFFHYRRDDAGNWHRTPMPFGGKRGQLCFDRNNDAYLIFTADGRLSIASARASNEWSTWRVVYTDDRLFTDQPLLDPRLLRDLGLLSVYVQEVPTLADSPASPLHVMDYRFASGDGP